MSLFTRLLIPRERRRKALSLDAQALSERSLRGLILDLDNTLVPYGLEDERLDVLAWVVALREAGIAMRFVSNAWPHRLRRWSLRLGIPSVGLGRLGMAGKPLPLSFLRACREMNLPPHEVAVVGDQLFTDVLGGNLIGAYTILVDPLASNDLSHTKAARRLERFVLTQGQFQAGYADEISEVAHESGRLEATPDPPTT